jgi:phosphinothricin acetyltransferase
MSTMVATITVRRALASDAARIAAIWNREVRDTLATTDTEPRTAAAQRAWLAAHTPAYPVLVAVVDDEIAGFAALAAYRPKPAFAHTVEDSIYVDEAWRGRGVGRRLLADLVDAAVAAGHHSMLARITVENLASRGLHEAAGFRLVGVEEAVAFKLGRWLDVALYQRRLYV